MRRRVVIYNDDDQVAKAQTRGNFDRFFVASLVEFSITQEAKYSTLRISGLQSMGQPHRHRKSVTQGAAADFDSRHQHSIRMLTQNGIVAAEPSEFIDCDEAFCSQNRVVGHWSVAFGE